MKKWRVPFEVAAQAFADPLLEEELDLRFDYGEDRFIAIGEAQGILLYVAFTLRGDDDDVVHIISARQLYPADLLMTAPSPETQKQLREPHIRLNLRGEEGGSGLKLREPFR